MSHLFECLFEVFCGGTKLGSLSFSFLLHSLSVLSHFFCVLYFSRLSKIMLIICYNPTACSPSVVHSLITLLKQSYSLLGFWELILCLIYDSLRLVCRLLLQENNEKIFALKVLITDYFSSMSPYYFSNYSCYKLEYLKSNMSESLTITFHLSKLIRDVAFFFLYLLEHLFIKNWKMKRPILMLTFDQM